MFNERVFAVAVCSLLYSFQAASSNVFSCNSCSEQQIERSAIDLAPNVEGSYEMYGFDLIGNKSRLYTITVSNKGVADSSGRPLYIRTIAEMTPPASFVYEVSQASNQLNREISSKWHIPNATGLNSASDLIDLSYGMTNLNNYLIDKYPFSYLGVTFLSSFGSVVNGALSGIQIVVTFDDGSEAKVQTNRITDTNLEYIYVDKSAKDKNGNTFPSMPDEYVGKTYKFDTVNFPQSFESFKQRAERYGITFKSGGSSGCTPSITYYTCSAPSNGKRVCSEKTQQCN